MSDIPFDLLPPAASAISGKVDLAIIVVLSVITLVILGVVVVMILFVLRYRRHAGRINGEARDPALIRRAELGFLAVTTAAFLGFFALGVTVYGRIEQIPDEPGALDIEVTAKRWMWSFRHPTGRRELARLHVPAGRLVRLHLASQDVIHSFYVPAFRLKHDVVPGWLRTTWFRATEPGVYALACAEYCGTEHSHMRADIEVMPAHLYDRWLARDHEDGPPLAAAGRRLFERFDCVACHETHQRRRAPPLVGVYGRTVVLQDGARIVADDDYIRRSIVRPDADVVAGYSGDVMPSYAGIVTEDELQLLVAYVRSLGGAEGVTP